jgi:transposase
MAAIPTAAEEDARRPSRGHQRLREESTALISRMKSTLVRSGIRNFNVKLVKACERLEALRGPEGVPLPPNTLAEMRRDMARRGHLTTED